jgi:hypothetical protein
MIEQEECSFGCKRSKTEREQSYCYAESRSDDAELMDKKPVSFISTFHSDTVVAVLNIIHLWEE